MRLRLICAAGFLAAMPAFAESCIGMGDAEFCTGEPAVTELQAPSEGRVSSGDHAGVLLPDKPSCISLGDASCD